MPSPRQIAVSSEPVVCHPGVNSADGATQAIRLQWQGHPIHSPAFCYRVAGQRVLSEAAIVQLEPFADPRQDLALSQQAKESLHHEEDRQVIYQGTGWLGDRWRLITCRSGSYGSRIHVEGMGQFAVDPGGWHVQRIDAEVGASPGLVVELLLGPVLCLALALHGVWCLHASAALVNGRAIAFLGASGAGKSTLARYLAVQGNRDGRRIADDILPVELSPGGAVALPHFPQLKLPAYEQIGQDCPQRLPLDAICVLEESDRVVGAAWHPLETQMATLALLSHTVAARLFDAKLLRRHLVFCAEVAATVPVRRLVYPRRLDALPAVLALLEQNWQP